MVIAIQVDLSTIADQRADFDNQLFLVRATAGLSFVYYSGSAWSKGVGGFDTRDIHGNARTAPYSRAEIVRGIMTLHEIPSAVATALWVSCRTVAKWLARYRAEGEAGLVDRSSRPHRIPRATATDIAEQVIAARRQRLCGKQIAAMLRLSPATVRRILQKARLSRARDLDPPEPVRRYERDHPGDLIHIDIKKLGRLDRVGHRITGDRTGQSNARSIGWKFVHVCIDDHSRIAFSDACKALGLRHIRTRPYTPKTNGKAERFIQTYCANGPMLARTLRRSTANTPSNHGSTTTTGNRPHGSLLSQPPIRRLGQPTNNLSRLHS